MRLALLTAALLTTCVSAAELPPVGFDQPGWTLAKGAQFDGEVVRITGGPGYRTARIAVPASIVGKRRFYFTVDVRLSDIVTGDELYMKPKVKVFSDGPQKRAVRAFHRGDCPRWTQVTVDYQLLGKQLPEAVTLEVALQDCAGVGEFRNPRLTWEHPPVECVYPFARPADPSASLALVSTALSPGEDRLLGTNQQWSWSPVGYEDERVQAFVRHVAPPSLRFPAGTVANFYDWKTDGFARPAPGVGPGWIDYQVKRDKRFAYEDYAALCLELGLSSPLTFNVLGDSVESSAARLRDRLDRGLRIEHIELGNENYFDNQRGGPIPDAEAYVAFCAELVAGLRAVDDRIPLAANIAGEGDHTVGAMAAWNAAIAAADFYDLVVLHPYLGVSSAIPDTTGIAQMLGLRRHLDQRIAECYQQFEVPIVVTEWGILGPEGSSESVAAAIGIADGFLTLIDHHQAGRVRSACIHLLALGDGAVGSGLYGLDRETMTIRTSRRGAVYELVLAAFRGAQVYAASSSSAELEPGLPAVSARAARRADGSLAVLAVNKLDVAAPLALSLDGAALDGGTITSYVEDSLAEGIMSWPLGEQPLTVAEFDGALPPLSVSLIELAP